MHARALQLVPAENCALYGKAWRQDMQEVAIATAKTKYKQASGVLHVSNLRVYWTLEEHLNPSLSLSFGEIKGMSGFLFFLAFGVTLLRSTSH